MTTEKRKRERKAGGRVGECKREGIERVTKMKQTPYWLLTNVSSDFAAWYKLLTSQFSLNKTLTYSLKKNWTAARETLHWYNNNTITDLGMTRERETEKRYLSHLKQNVCWRKVWAGGKGQVLLSTACALRSPSFLSAMCYSEQTDDTYWSLSDINSSVYIWSVKPQKCIYIQNCWSWSYLFFFWNDLLPTGC